MTSQRTFVIAALFTTCLVVAASALTLPSHFEEPELDRLQQIHSTAQRLQELIRLHVLHTSHGHSLLAKTVRCVDHNPTQSGGIPLGCDNLNQTINATLDCPTAQDQFNNLTQFCNVPYIVNGFADPLSVNISDIDKFCTGDCVTQLDLHLAQVVRSCWNNGSLDSFLLDAVREALIASKVPCLRVESSYCFSVWQNLTRISGFLANGTLSQQQILDTCWSDCADEQHAQLIRYGGGRQLGTTGFLKLLCTKVGVDEYCALVYQEVEKANQVTPPPPPPPPPPSNNTNSTNSSSPSNSTVPDNSTSGSNSTVDPAEPPGTNGTCRICYRRFVQRANKTLTLAQGSGGVSNFNQQDFADRVNRLTYQCTRDSSGLCLDKISKNAQKSNNHQDLSSPCGTVFDNVNGPINDTCTSQCAKALKDLSNDLGCCALTFFQQKFNSSITDGYNPQLEHIYNFIKNSCQVSQFANSCSNKRIDFKLVLVNVRYSWLSNTTNYAHFADAVRRDIAARLGVPFNSVKVLAIQDYIPTPATNNNSTDDVQCIDGERRVRRGVLVSGYVLPQTAAEVSQLQGSFAKAVLENRIDFSEAATWLPFDFQGRIDVLSQFGLNGVVSNITRVNNPGA